MNLLVTLDSKYIKPLKVMLISLFLNNPSEQFHLYLMHSGLKEAEIADIGRFVESRGQKMTELKIDAGYFEDAPVIFHYTKEMYYRLLAYKFLPEELDRILYLDPDILVINPVRKLYDTDLDGYLFAAAYHSVFLASTELNRIRLYPYKISAYFNSGVLLMNLKLQRRLMDENEIYDFIEKNRAKLLMPDQDIINALYSDRIKSLDEKIYNYDVRYYKYYKITNSTCDMDFILRNTVFLHFCGKKKPWLKGYSGQFHSLYKHYERLAFPA